MKAPFGNTDHGNVLLSALNLSIGYKNRNVENVLLEDLNLQVKAGELICFMGPNGIGKTTLIRTLAGLQTPLKGSVLSGPSTDSPLAKNAEKNISLVLTDRISAVNMTVDELVTYGRYPYVKWNLKLRPEDRKAIELALEQTRITHLIGKKLFELSDGQIQLVMITRALAQDTPLILLDEPTAHLDLNNRVEIMNLLRKLSRKMNKGIIVATHELDLALQTADLIWLAGKNKKILQGIPEDLVLNGSFDDIFQLKGYDLKTGKVFHEPWRDISISVTGSGYEYLWTKNALERNGFTLSDEGKRIIIDNKDGNLSWLYNHQRYSTLHELILNV
ncbi:MAG: ABC transporter ATP-binding protein [Cyclobacteriaceae bacterium]|nr:ABC transporter ATP-binding protein [Cyclobacteriaceae bacterium]